MLPNGEIVNPFLNNLIRLESKQMAFQKLPSGEMRLKSDQSCSNGVVLDRDKTQDRASRYKTEVQLYQRHKGEGINMFVNIKYNFTDFLLNKVAKFYKINF